MGRLASPVTGGFLVLPGLLVVGLTLSRGRKLVLGRRRAVPLERG